MIARRFRVTLTAAAAVLAMFAGGVVRSAPPSVESDEIVDRAFVPSAERPQGEVRIVRRGGRAVVQTVLYTRVPRRVFGAIAEKERRNWPAESPGHADSERYLAALAAFEAAANGAQTDRRVLALIEFVDATSGPVVTVGAVELDGIPDDVRIRGRSQPAILELSERYVLRNMRLIVADSFHLSEDEAAARLDAGIRAGRDLDVR